MSTLLLTYMYRPTTVCTVLFVGKKRKQNLKKPKQPCTVIFSAILS